MSPCGVLSELTVGCVLRDLSLKEISEYEGDFFVFKMSKQKSTSRLYHCNMRLSPQRPETVGHTAVCSEMTYFAISFNPDISVRH